MAKVLNICPTNPSRPISMAMVPPTTPGAAHEPRVPAAGKHRLTRRPRRRSWYLRTEGPGVTFNKNEPSDLPRQPAPSTRTGSAQCPRRRHFTPSRAAHNAPDPSRRRHQQLASRRDIELCRKRARPVPYSERSGQFRRPCFFQSGLQPLISVSCDGAHSLQCFLFACNKGADRSVVMANPPISHSSVRARSMSIRVRVPASAPRSKLCHRRGCWRSPPLRRRQHFTVYLP